MKNDGSVEKDFEQNVEARRQLEEWIKANPKVLYRWARSRISNPADAQDIAQETFMRAWQSAERFKGGSIEAWLRQIFNNLVIDTYRMRTKRAALDPIHAADQATFLEPDEEKLARGKRLSPLLAEHLAQLPVPLRDVLIASAYGESPTEIAQKLSVAVGTVHSRKYHARKRFLKDPAVVRHAEELGYTYETAA